MKQFLVVQPSLDKFEDAINNLWKRGYVLREWQAVQSIGIVAVFVFEHGPIGEDTKP
jgi:hypothetical protein